MRWEEDGEFNSVFGFDPEAVKAVREVDLGHVDRAKSIVRTMYFIEYSVKRSSKLHCLAWRERDGIVIDIVEAVVGDHTVAAPPLWD